MTDLEEESAAVVETLQREKIMEGVKDHLSQEGREWLEERREKDEFLSEHFFSPEMIERLEEGTLRQMIRRMWAYGSWTNKDYLLDEMLKSGLPTIRSCFEFLLFSDAPLAERFDRIVTDVRMMGAASVSEMLCHFDKSRYAIWNRRAREGLVRLGVSEGALPASPMTASASRVRTTPLLHASGFPTCR